MGRLQLHSSYHQLSTVQSICLPGDTYNTGTPLQTVTLPWEGLVPRWIMLQLLIHNYVLHTHTHRHTHTRIRAWVYNSSMHSVRQGGPAHRGPCTEGTPVPGRLVDKDGLRSLPLAQRTGQGQSGVVSFLVWELVRLQEPLHRRRREDGLRLARQVRHWSLRHSV